MKKQFAFILLLTIWFLMLAATKAETGMGYWNEGGYGGGIQTIGDDSCRAVFSFIVSSDLTQIRIPATGSGFWDSNGNVCLLPDNTLLTKQATQYSDFFATPTMGACAFNSEHYRPINGEYYLLVMGFRLWFDKYHAKSFSYLH